jgi:hypothetical protein
MSDEIRVRIEDIPEDFHQDGEGKPFCKCTFCSKDLVNSGEPYMIEKSYKRVPQEEKALTVFEYAICMSCNIEKMKAMSKESVENIQAYMQENILIIEQLASEQQKSFTEKTSSCVATGKAVTDLEEFNMVGQFIGDKMIMREFPVIISAEIGEEIQDLLSAQTREELDNFMDTVNGVPPELKELFKSTRRPVLV